MTNKLIQIQNGKVNFGSFEAAPAPSTPAAAGANFIPLTAVTPQGQSETPYVEITEFRDQLAAKSGPEYWRSLNELAQKPEFEAAMTREFPGGAPTSWKGLSRRNFLRLMGASLALAGLAGCARQPEERIVPYVKQPEDLIPGKPLFFASAHNWNGYGRGILVESHMGRPTKIEGNPDHPSSLGATDAVTQAALLTMYDPERSQLVTRNGQESNWDSFMGEARKLMDSQKASRGAGLRILTETVTSPTVTAQLRELLTQLPEARWHVWEPAGYDNARQGARLAFGSDVSINYRFEMADVIVSLDANFLNDEAGSVRFARDFSDGRRVRTREGKTKMNRLYAVESTPAITGASADHRWPMKASEIGDFAGALAGKLGISGASGSAPEYLDAIVSDLQGVRGRSIVIAGMNQPPEVHALVYAINEQLGNIGNTVLVTEPVESTPADSLQSLTDLVADMNAGAVDMVVILGANPVYTAPADLEFLEAFKKVKTRVRLGLYDDETSNWCHWHVPQSHFLEEWSDIRAHDGTISIVQPLIEPLYSTVSVHQFLAVLTGRTDRNDYNIVREYWKTRAAELGGADFEPWWRKALNDGVVPGTQAKPVSLAVQGVPAVGARAASAELEVTFHVDPCIRDGRDANNGWLQELPRPMTKMTWDNAALVSVATARKLNLKNYEMVKLTVGGRSLELPIWIMPGQPEDSIAVQLGFGRTRAGKVAEGAGFDTYQLRASDGLWFAGGAKIEKLSGKLFTLAVTQEHHRLDTSKALAADSWLPNSSSARQQSRDGDQGDVMDSFHGREDDILHVIPLADLQGDPAELHRKGVERARKEFEQPGFMPPVWPSDRIDVDENGVPVYDSTKKGYGGNPVPAWGMTIDLNTCIGCNACTAACTAENNVAVVGKEEVVRGREMHWIRIDRYYRGDVANPESYHQPIACMHCEKAPCEPVCPVEATSHSSEGINEMTYNRCVGTKYCSNNCPYKVRRFNFLQYSELDSVPLQLMANPDVTVRARGVMEKCTFCIQRINAARIQAEKEDRPIRDGDMVTACQQVCPTNAIIFGNVADKESAVYAAKSEPHNYGVLTELNTLPRTTYLAKLKNPNPMLVEA